MPKKKENLISQTEAGKIAGVSKQAIGSIKKNSNYNFFVGSKVNTNHSDWKVYLHERKSSGKEIGKKSLPKSSKKKSGKIKKKKSTVKKTSVKTRKKESKKIKIDRDNNPFTGGVDPSRFIPKGTADLKRFAEIAKIKLEIEKNLGEYIDREILTPVLESIGRTIQAYFVNLPRKLSGRICKKLNRIGMERKVEKMMADPIAKGIQEVKAAAIKAGRVR